MWAAASGAEGAAAAERFKAALEARSRPELGDEDRGLLEQIIAQEVVWHGAGIGDEDDARGRAALIARWNELARNGEAAQLTVGDDVYADSTTIAGSTSRAGGCGPDRPPGERLPPERAGQPRGQEAFRRRRHRAGARNGDPVEEREPRLQAARARATSSARTTWPTSRFLREDVKWISRGEGGQSPEEVVAMLGQFKEMTGGRCSSTSTRCCGRPARARCPAGRRPSPTGPTSTYGREEVASLPLDGNSSFARRERVCWAFGQASSLRRRIALALDGEV
jgi:hypothetical protein